MENKDKKIDWREAKRKADRTAKWAKIMTKQRLRFASLSSKKWQIVSFEGPKGAESTGIIDLMAIRRAHNKPQENFLKRGDLFEIILIQTKGGAASKPKEEDIRRLLRVGDYYRAKHILLTEWEKGKSPIFKKLLRNLKWVEINPKTIFK